MTLNYKYLIMAKPKTLQEAIKYYSDEANCIRTVAEMRWPNGPSCPACGHMQHYWLESQKRWKCKECWKQFSVKLGTIFEDSPISLEKWLIALWMLCNCKNGVSSYEIARTIGVTQKSAWFMLQRLRLALQDRQTTKLGGSGSEVEVDESYIGGKVRNMHKSRKTRMSKARSQIRNADATVSERYWGKTAVMGMLDREQRKVRATVVPNVRRETLQNKIFNEIEHGTKLYTDSAVAYDSLANKYAHEIVNHLEGYVRGRVHTNGLENFWSLLKRGLNGTYVAVEPFHLFRYVDEQMFRYNNRGSRERKISDCDRFELALSQIAGKRLTFAEVTGKEEEAAF
jgi:transposase-like protein